MIGRKSVLSLSLLGAMMLCAFSAQSAFAVSGWTADHNTTAYECTKSAAELQFSDAHCDNTGGSTYGHTKLGASTAISVTNAGTASSTTASTPAVLHGEPFGIATTITGTTVTGSGTINNDSTNHRITGTVTTVYKNLDVESELGGCEVPGGKIEFTVSFESVHKANGEMGLEYKPINGPETPFVVIPLSCLGGLIELEVPVNGTAVGVGKNPSANESGATQFFSASTEELESGGSPATFNAAYTTTVTSNGNGVTGTTGE
jgi:hypothetical protein